MQILVNRNYKPVGSTVPENEEIPVYEDYANAHVRFTDARVETIVIPASARRLFVDGNEPWIGKLEGKEYLARLYRLMIFLSLPEFA